MRLAGPAINTRSKGKPGDAIRMVRDYQYNLWCSSTAASICLAAALKRPDLQRPRYSSGRAGSVRGGDRGDGRCFRIKSEHADEIFVIVGLLLFQLCPRIGFVGSVVA